MPLPLKIATACFIKREGKTLFLDYTNYPHPIHSGKYSIPGGRVEEGESIEDCVKREISEETSIMPCRVTYRGKVLFVNGKRTINGKPMSHNFEVHFYECIDFDDTNARATEGRLAWVEDNNVLGLPLHEGDRIIWKDWLSRYQRFEGEIEHEGEKLTSAKLISGVAIN